MLEVRKNRFAKPYENDFFRILAGKLSKTFESLKLNGVLLGSPVCTKFNDLQLDALLISETAIIIIDFKNYGGKLQLPKVDNFDNGEWILQPNKRHDRTVVVKGGSGNKNPFKQVNLQREKLNNLLTNHIVSHLPKGTSIEIKNTCSAICFQQSIELSGVIPDYLKHAFYITDPKNIVDKLRDIIDVVPNEWKGEINGYKLNKESFDLIKKIFLADPFDPFADNNLFSDFDKIKYPEAELASKFELVNSEYEKSRDSIEKFINTDIPVLIINSDVTSYRVELIEKITSNYLTSKEDIPSDSSIESKVCFLAPNNRHVADLIRIGAPGYTSSLYGKLYDFEHSTIELLSNSMNEKEVFPLLENKQANGMLYVIFNAHLVYNFESGSEDLVKFGSGSLCNDTLKYLDVKNRKNKVILVNDPYFYGHRAETIATATILESNSIGFIEIEMTTRPLEDNQKNISDLIKNIKQNNFSHFSFNNNPNIKLIIGNDFKTEIDMAIKSEYINNQTILTREKNENKGVNSWIRKTKGINQVEIHTGDVIWVKNRAIVPEEVDPFSIPKHVLSGDIGEVLEVIEKYEFGSPKYKFEPIKVTKCKVKLRDYEAIRDLYISTISMDDISNQNELKKHIQIRSREIVDEYLEKNNIQIKDILQPKEFEEYLKEKDKIQESNGLLKDVSVEVDKDKIEASFKKLDAKWRINKRKELFVKSELIKNIHSEYFKISQLIHFDFAWAVCLKSCYGYNFNESYLLEYSNASKNIDRFHQYLYSAIGCSEKIKVHNFVGLNPWFNISTVVSSDNSNTGSEKNQILTKINLIDFDEKDRLLIKNYKLEDVDPHLVLICRWLLDKLDSKTEFTLHSIEHFPYQEKYHFVKGTERILLILSYNKVWEIKVPKNNSDNEVYRYLSELTNNAVKEPYLFIQKDSWQKEELVKLQIILQTKGAFIYHFEASEWKFDLKISSEHGDCVSQLFYNKNGFFSSINFISGNGTEASSVLLESINELKAGN